MVSKWLWTYKISFKSVPIVDKSVFILQIYCAICREISLTDVMSECAPGPRRTELEIVKWLENMQRVPAPSWLMFGQAGSPGGLTSHMETLPTITQRLHHLDRSCVHIGSPSIRYYDVGRLESRYRPWWYEHTASTTLVTERQSTQQYIPGPGQFNIQHSLMVH